MPGGGDKRGRVSNPYRYGRNRERTRVHVAGRDGVSNPYRYGRNIGQAAARWVGSGGVSNPYRYGRNSWPPSLSATGGGFQTLIGTVGTGHRHNTFGGNGTQVSNPYRYGRNDLEAPPGPPGGVVSNPYRYGRNSRHLTPASPRDIRRFQTLIGTVGTAYQCARGGPRE